MVCKKNFIIHTDTIQTFRCVFLIIFFSLIDVMKKNVSIQNKLASENVWRLRYKSFGEKFTLRSCFNRKQATVTNHFSLMIYQSCCSVCVFEHQMKWVGKTQVSETMPTLTLANYMYNVRLSHHSLSLFLSLKCIAETTVSAMLVCLWLFPPKELPFEFIFTDH